MSEENTEKTLFDSLKGVVKEQLHRAGAEIGQELMAKVGQGASELAAGLFAGNAYVMYGQRSSEKQQPVEQTQTQEPMQHEPESQELQQERGGRGR